MSLINKCRCRFFPGRRHTLKEVEDAIRRCRGRNAVKTWIRVAKDLNVILPQTEMRPMDLALESSNTLVLQLLLDRGVKADSRTKDGLTPVFAACARGLLECVICLVEHGADITFRSPNGLTCLLVAAEKEHFSIVDYLLEQKDCNVNEVGKDGQSVLHYTSRFNHASTTSNLVHARANIDAQNKYGESPLFLAVKHGCLDSLKVLLEAGADPNIEIKGKDGGVSGHCSLHEAVSQGNVEIVELLVKYKANVLAVRSDDVSAIDIALALTPLKAEIVNALLKSSTVSEQVKRLASRCLKAEQAARGRKPLVGDGILCPITLELVRDPVIAADGHTYEREAIEVWLKTREISPITRQPMSSKTLRPNFAIKHIINSAPTQ